MQTSDWLVLNIVLNRIAIDYFPTVAAPIETQVMKIRLQFRSDHKLI